MEYKEPGINGDNIVNKSVFVSIQVQICIWVFIGTTKKKKKKRSMMKNLHSSNLVEIGSRGPEIWAHEYLISPTEISVKWPGS